MNTNMTQDQAQKFSDQLVAQDPSHNTALAAAFGVSSEAPNISSKMIQGWKALKLKGTTAPRSDLFTNDFEAYVGDSVPNERVRAMIKGGVRALLTQNMLLQGKSPKDATSDDFNIAMQEMMGPEMEINGFKTLSFRTEGNWVDEDQLQDFINDMTAEDLINLGPGIPLTNEGPLTMDNLKEDMRYLAVGDGLYAVVNKNGQFTLDGNGNTYVLNMKELVAKKGLESKSFFKTLKGLFD